MSPFEKQGQNAFSIEPFSLWCAENGIDLHVSANRQSLHTKEGLAWNTVLEATSTGSFELAQLAISELQVLEQTTAGK